MSINLGRMTHEYDGELVVLLIGMRVNKFWRIDQWLPVFAAMPGMITELAKAPDSGFLGFRLVFGGRGAMVVQYWNSLDKLYDYAKEPSALHRPVWAQFNQRARKVPGAVGIWHETYTVKQAESIYVAMPDDGLAKATTVIPVSNKLNSARERYAR